MTAFEQEPAVLSAEGPGRRLRLAREQRRLTIPEVADALHLERGVVEALEADDYESLPPVTFTKGYLRAYARALDLDEDEILAAFRRVGVREAERPLTASVGRESRSRRGNGAGWVAVVLALAVVGAGWFLWYREGATPRWLADLGAVVAPQSEPASRADADADAGATAGTSGPASGSAGAGEGAASGETRPEADLAAPPADDGDAPGAEPAGDSLADTGGVAAAPWEGAVSVGGDTGVPATGSTTAGGPAPATPAAEDTGTQRLTDDEPDFGGPLSEAPPEPGLAGSGDAGGGSDASEPAPGGAGGPGIERDTVALAETEDTEAGATTTGPEDPDAAANGADAAPEAAAGGASSAAADPAVATDDGDGASSEDAGDGAEDSDGARVASSVAPSTAAGQATESSDAGDRGSAADAESGTDATPVPGDATSEQESLVFAFDGESWMEVRDARGRRLLFGLVTGGGKRRVEGVPPFDIVVGDVNRVTVTYDGERVDLDRFTRGSVARLQLGQ